MFKKGTLPEWEGEEIEVSGTLNGEPFQSPFDSDHTYWSPAGDVRRGPIRVDSLFGAIGGSGFAAELLRDLYWASAEVESRDRNRGRGPRGPASGHGSPLLAKPG